MFGRFPKSHHPGLYDLDKFTVNPIPVHTALLSTQKKIVAMSYSVFGNSGNQPMRPFETQKYATPYWMQRTPTASVGAGSYLSGQFGLQPLFNPVPLPPISSGS